MHQVDVNSWKKMMRMSRVQFPELGLAVSIIRRLRIRHCSTSRNRLRSKQIHCWRRQYRLGSRTNYTEFVHYNIGCFKMISYLSKQLYVSYSAVHAISSWPCIILCTAAVHTSTLYMSRRLPHQSNNRECAFGLSVRGRCGSRLPACILRSSSGVKWCG